MKGAKVGDTGAELKPPVGVKAEVFEGDAVEITWKDTCSGEAGFRVDRKIDDKPESSASRARRGSPDPAAP